MNCVGCHCLLAISPGQITSASPPLGEASSTQGSLHKNILLLYISYEHLEVGPNERPFSFFLTLSTVLRQRKSTIPAYNCARQCVRQYGACWPFGEGRLSLPVWRAPLRVVLVLLHDLLSDATCS